MKGIIIVFVNSSNLFVKTKSANFQNYLEIHRENNYIPSEGYIADSRTAVQIGGEIIDILCDKGVLNIGFKCFTPIRSKGTYV